MQALSLIALVCLTGCSTVEHNWKPVAIRSPKYDLETPVEFSFDEITTRRWIQAPGQTVGLVGNETFEASAPKRLQILVAKYGIAQSNQIVCIDFYAVREARDGKTYHLLCHDQNCPTYRTKVRCETQDGRTIFTIWREPRVGNFKCDLETVLFRVECEMPNGKGL